MTRFARHERAQHAGFQINPFDLKSVLAFTKKLFTSERPANPHTPLTATQILGDLEESRNQIAHGEGLDMETALENLGRKYGFV